MFYRFLNAVSDGVFKKKYFLLYDGEKTFHLIKILKRLCYYYEKKAWYNLLPCSGLRNLCQRFYHAPNILSRGTKYCARKRLAMLILKWKGWFQVLISHFISLLPEHRDLNSFLISGSWFLKKVSQSAGFFTTVLTCIQKKIVPIFPTFLALSLYYLHVS